jgi:superfamily II DNA or RNA helicase
MQKGELTADIVRTWMEKWGKDKTLAFGVDCAHAQHIKDRFEHAGISCGYQDAQTSADERREIKRKFHNGEYRVVANVGTLTTGVDWDVRCLILARPTKSEMLFVQIIGRALRTADGKYCAIILDHSDTTQRLGFVTDIHHEHLDDGKPKEKAEAKPREALPRECKNCTALIPPKVRACPECGHEVKRETSIVERDGVLFELTPDSKRQKKEKRDWSTEERHQFYRELLGVCEERGYKPGWASNKYRERFGTWPPYDFSKVAEYPSPSTRSWVKSRQIAYAMAKKKADNHPHASNNI